MTQSSATQSPLFRNPVALALAVIAWGGVLLQLWLSLRLAHANGMSVVAGVWVYLGYFTVLTNIFVALQVSVQTFAVSNPIRQFFASAQTLACAATGIAVVGLGYHLLLRHIWNPQGLQWLADTLLHYVVPVAYCLYWLLALPKARLPWWSPLAWCIYPVAYFAYALVRGVMMGTYPYPFIDVAAIGYGQTFLNALGLLVVFVLVGWFLLAIRTGIEYYKDTLQPKSVP